MIIIIIIILIIGKDFVLFYIREMFIFFFGNEDIMPVGQILEVKIKMEEIGIQIIMNGKIKILIQIQNVLGIIIYHHQIITIINGMEIII